MTEGKMDELEPSDHVITAVAEREGVDPTELHQPLDDVIDPEALNAIFSDRMDGGRRDGGRVVFEYVGYVVTVETDGSVSLEPVQE